MEEIKLEKLNNTKKYLTIILITLIILYAAYFSDFDPIEVIYNINRGGSMFKRLFWPPNWNYVRILIAPLIESIKIAVVGTVIGAIISIPISVLSAENFIHNKYMTSSMRFVLNIIRTIPALVLASLFVATFGIGAFSGVLAIAVFSFGLISKLTYESIESIDHGQVEALTTIGADKLNILRYAVIPQVLPQFLSYTIYAFEVNVRAAAVLGYVGAGGIGQTYEINLAYRHFSNVGTIIIFTFAVVLIIDFISARLRSKLV